MVSLEMIEITSSAAEQIKVLLAEKKLALADAGLRITVENGGCSGMQYVMACDSRRPADQIFRRQDVEVLVDESSLPYLDGSTIDYVDALMGAGFRIRNPHAKQTCGCGTSFEADTAGAGNHK